MTQSASFSGSETVSDLRLAAALQVATETLTPEGGITRQWTTLSIIFIALSLEDGEEVTSPGLPPRHRQFAQAIARDHSTAARGQQLVVQTGAEVNSPWLVQDVRHATPSLGFMRLSLSRWE